MFKIIADLYIERTKPGKITCITAHQRIPGALDSSTQLSILVQVAGGN
jgi:hypothetical protein